MGTFNTEKAKEKLSKLREKNGNTQLEIEELEIKIKKAENKEKEKFFELIEILYFEATDESDHGFLVREYHYDDYDDSDRELIRKLTTDSISLSNRLTELSYMTDDILNKAIESAEEDLSIAKAHVEILKSFKDKLGKLKK